MIPLLSTERRWYCPNCLAEDVTYDPRPHSRMHICKGLRGGLTAPMIPAGTRAKVEGLDREDYVGDELVQKDGNGRPIMSVVTTRDDGQDTVVFAPTALGRIR